MFAHYAKQATVVAMLFFTATAVSAKDIVDVAAGNDSFSTLVAAVKAAGLVETLKGDGPFTVFAPTNEAFAKLPEGTVEGLLKPENKQKLIEILTYHVVPGKVLAKDVVGLSEAKSVEGSTIAIKVVDGQVKLNDATVIKTDIETSNGVIHVIDSVILPPEKTSQVSPRHVIENAIAQGAPQYNAGHAGRCCMTYSSAITRLMKEYAGEMPTHVRDHLQVSLDNANKMHCMDSRAWALRRALDQVYASM